MSNKYNIQINSDKPIRYQIRPQGQNDELIEWVVVRPDGLIDMDKVTNYGVHPSPTRSAIFDAGQTSLINVGHFMAELIASDDTWQKWIGQMPVIYNKVILEKI